MKLTWIIIITVINSVFIMFNTFGVIFALAALERVESLSIFQRIGVTFVTLLPLLSLLSVIGLWYAYSKDFSTKWYYLGFLPFIFILLMGITMMVLLPSQAEFYQKRTENFTKKKLEFYNYNEVLKYTFNKKIVLPDFKIEAKKVYSKTIPKDSSKKFFFYDFIIYTSDDSSLVLSLKGGQLPPSPAKFTIGDKSYKLHIHKTPHGDKIEINSLYIESL